MVPATPAADLRALCSLLGAELAPGVGVACTDANGDCDTLWPGEGEAVRNAVPRRQREFAAGRSAAREALARIGLPPRAIPSAPDRAPVWPEGVVGSIAHNTRACVAIVGRQEEVHGLGIDIEDQQPLDEGLWRTICTPDELGVLATLPAWAQGLWVTRVFCAKEAYYKWQYPQTGRMLDFCDVQVSFDHEGTQFRVREAAPGKAPVLTSRHDGSLRLVDGFAVAWLAGAPSAGPSVQAS